MICKYCGKDKPKEDFRTAKRCKSCWAIYYRAWYEQNRDRLLKYKAQYNTSAHGQAVLRKSHVKNAKQRKTRVQVKMAIQQGKLIKPDRCVTCRRKGAIEGHHIDYDKPLEVIWLCKSCHHKLHRSI